MDLEYINLIIASIALLSSFIGHLRHSRCCYGLIDVDMRKSSPSTTPTLTTPFINQSSQPIDANLKSSKDDFLPQKKSNTFRSDIPKVEIKKNYL